MEEDLVPDPSRCNLPELSAEEVPKNILRPEKILLHLLKLVLEGRRPQGTKCDQRAARTIRSGPGFGARTGV